MKKNATFLIVLFSVILFILLGISLGRYASSAFASKTSNAACIVKMADVIASAQGAVYDVQAISENAEPKSYILATYSVIGDEIKDPILSQVPGEFMDEQKDAALQMEAWQVFTKLIPLEDRQMVAQYIIFTDENGNTLAAVEQTTKDPAQWIIEVDIADLGNKDELLFTLIHEYAHLLTLNESQVLIDEEVFRDPYNVSLIEKNAAACPNYYTDGGCSLPNSYVHAFHQRFWLDIDEEWGEVNKLQYAEDLFPYYEGLYNFYLTHKDQFLDDYSTTHPTEDIAEAFAYFVFSPKPAGDSIKDQKVSFFYEYPELIELRQSILQSMCSATQ